jgi:hypothetical protein
MLPRWLVGGGLFALVVVVAVRGQFAAHFLKHDLHPLDFAVLAAVPVGALVLRRRVTAAAAFGWQVGLALFVVGLTAWHVLPDHATQASRGRPAAELATWAKAQGMPVVTFRGSWEASEFYLGEELVTYHSHELGRLAAYLRQQRRALILVRPVADRVRPLLDGLPPEVRVIEVLDRQTVHGIVVGPA